MDHTEANKQINVHVQAAYEALRKAEAIADLSGVEFTFELTYGAGATYFPVKFTRAKALELIESGVTLTTEQRAKVADVLRNPDDYSDNDWQSSTVGWQSCSSMC